MLTLVQLVVAVWLATASGSLCRLHPTLRPHAAAANTDDAAAAAGRPSSCVSRLARVLDVHSSQLAIHYQFDRAS